uniref:SH3 domain-containing protein n=1 Tax=Rhabditophanes sp. KR3021 TaxID=114890 RepID=A0AC35TZS7_9BILA
MHSLARTNLQQFINSYKEPNKQNGWGPVENKRVSFAAKALSDFNGCLDNDVPVPGKAISFLTGQFLHIYEKFNNDWWIGRLVSDGSPVLGFIPTPSKFHQIKSHRHKILQRTIKQRNSFMSSSKKKGLNKEGEVELHEQASYYDIVPCMRPVCLIGPSLKGFNASFKRSLQKQMLI